MTLSTVVRQGADTHRSSGVFSSEGSASVTDSKRGNLLQARWHLACVEGPDLGAVIPLRGVSGSYTLGRIHSVITDPEVSRVHLLLRWTPSGVEVCDAHSANGSQLVRQRRLRASFSSSGLPRRRISEEQWSVLHVGDEVCFGSSRWQLRSRPRAFIPPQPTDVTPLWLGFLHPRKPAEPSGANTALRPPLTSRAFQRPLRFLSITFSLLFLPISVGRVLGISPWWTVSLVGISVAFSIFIPMMRRTTAFSWDGAHLLIALDKPASLSTPSQHTWSDPVQSSPVVLSPHTPVIDLPIRDGQNPPTVGFYGPKALLHALWAIATYSLPWSGCTVYSSQGVYEIGAGGPHVHLCEASTGELICRFDELSSCAQALHCIVADDVAFLPSWCTHIGDCDSDTPVSVTWAALLLHRMPEVSREYVLPPSVLLEDLWAEDSAIMSPSMTQFSDTLTPEPRKLRAPIGRDSSGKVFSIDFIHDGPHCVIVGTTGSGKSEAVITVVCSLARMYSPRDLRIVAVDYKGGASLSPLMGLPHLDALVTDLSPQNTQRVFEGLRYVVREREALLASQGYSSLSDWESHDRSNAPARIIIAFDEFTTFASMHPELFEDALRLAAQGRALGLHVIFATQRPDRALNAAVLSNVDLRIALRCRDNAASQAVLGSYEASKLPPIPGRAIADGHGLFQTGWIPRVSQVVQKIGQRWSHVELTPLWVAGLPHELSGAALALAMSETLPHSVISGDNANADATLHCPIGLVDGIAVGAHYPLYWTGGHCRFEAEYAQRHEVWGTLCALAQQCALSAGAKLIVCSSRSDMPFDDTVAYQHISLSSPADVVALAAGGISPTTHATTPGKLVVLEDVEHTQRVLNQALGSAYGQALWNTWINSASHEGITIFAASYQPHSLWDKEGHIFAYRFLKAVNTSQIQICGLSGDVQPHIEQGVFVALSAPVTSSLSSAADSPSFPQTVRLIDSGGTKFHEKCGQSTQSQPNKKREKLGWMNANGENFSPTENSVVILSADENHEQFLAWKNNTPASQAHFVDITEWMKIPSLLPPIASPDCIVITRLNEEIRRILLPAAYQSDWLLRLNNLPRDRALILEEGNVTLLSYYK